jgi:transposase InsO family protein
VPLSHPFVERLIGTVRRELLDHVPFWSARDLERKLAAFMAYYNEARTHRSLDGETPVGSPKRFIRLVRFGGSRIAGAFISCRFRPD